MFLTSSGHPQRKKFMEPSRDPFGKEDPSPQSINELLDLLLKLKAKLKEKIRPPKKKETGSGQTDLVIIIMTNQEEQPRSGKPIKMEKPEAPAGDWMGKMFSQIEGAPVRRRKKS
jgi:hypothetical protein